MTSAPTAASPTLAGRYGTVAPRRRPRVYAAIALLAVLALAWTAWAGLSRDSGPLSGQVTGYTSIGAHVVRARVAVTGTGVAGTCTLRALDRDRAVIGRARLAVPGGVKRGTRSVDLRVLTTVSSVELVRCSAP